MNYPKDNCDTAIQSIERDYPADADLFKHILGLVEQGGHDTHNLNGLPAEHPRPVTRVPLWQTQIEHDDTFGLTQGAHA